MNNNRIITFFIIFCLIFLLIINSCVSKAAQNDQLYAYITNNARFILLHPEKIENPMDMIQYISASYQSQTYFFNALVQADETGIDMILLNEMGVNMGNLSYKDGSLNFSSLLFPRSMRPEYIVADFQLCFYDPAALNEVLDQSNLTLVLDGAKRRILDGREVIIEIEKTHREVKLTNHLRGYSYTLEGEFL